MKILGCKEKTAFSQYVDYEYQDTEGNELRVKYTTDYQIYSVH